MQRIWRVVVSSAIVGLALCGCNKPAPVSAGKWGYIDKKGYFIIKPQFDEASDFNKDGRAFVRSEKRILGLKANPPGESTDPVKPDDSTALAPGPTLRAAEGEGETYKVMDGKKVVFDVAKGAATDEVFHGNDYVCVLFGKKCAFIDKQGKIFLAPFEDARDFSEGRAAVQDGHKWGFINRKGLFVIPPKYIGAGDFVGGLAPVEIPAEVNK
jgi:hypothetical protein